MENDITPKKPRVNPEDYIDAPRQPFKKGNPGRPKGCLNKNTIARNAIFDMFLDRKSELKRLEFKKLVDAIVALLPKKIEGEGFADTNIVNVIQNYPEIDAETRRRILDRVGAGRSEGQSV